MKSSRLALRQDFLRLLYELAMLELTLEQAKDEYKEATEEKEEERDLHKVHNTLIEITSKKYEIRHVQWRLSENWKKNNILF